MKKLLTFLMVIVIAMPLMLMSCTTTPPVVEESTPPASTDSEPAPAADTGAKKIAFMVDSLSNETWAMMAESAERQGPERGYEVTVLSAEANATTQITQIENCIEFPSEHPVANSP